MTVSANAVRNIRLSESCAINVRPIRYLNAINMLSTNPLRYDAHPSYAIIKIVTPILLPELCAVQHYAVDTL